MSSNTADIRRIVSSDGQHRTEAPRNGHGKLGAAEFQGATLENLLVERDHIPGIVKESTVWDVYNNEARKVDNELVKDWTTSLNSLLLFVSDLATVTLLVFDDCRKTAIFAAVLTAFIIESKKMLEDDQTEILVDIMIFYNTNLVNGSHSPYSRSKFIPSTAAVSINCLLFASLGTSLIAALASVIALQWVADYDAAITRGGSSPEDRARRRQFRFAGVVQWKMAEIIAALPLLLYCSVVLFWAGTIQWMWTINRIVTYVVAGGTTVVVLFYFITTLLATVYVSAPFRTPLSRGLYWTHRLLLSLLYNALDLPPLRTMGQVALILLQPASNISHRFASYLRNNALAKWIGSHSSHGDADGRSHRNLMWWIRTHVLPGITSRQREDEVAERDPRLGQQALGWLAQQLNISPDSHLRLLLLLREVTRLSSAETLSRSFLQVSWPEILDSLGWHYMRKILDVKVDEEDYEAIGILVRCSKVPELAAKILPGPNYATDPSEADYWAQSCFNLSPHKKPQPSILQNMTFLLARDVPVPSADSQYELETTTKLIRWRNSAGMKNNDIWSDIFMNIEPFSSRYLEACLRCFELVVLCSLSKQPYEYSFKQDASRLVVFDSKSRTFMERADLGPIFSVILRPGGLSRVFTRGEMLALLQCLEIWVTRKNAGFPEEFTPNTAIRRPLLYGALLSYMFNRHREIHYEATFFVARMVSSLPKVEQPQWKRTIVMLLWLGRLKPVNYWYNLVNIFGEEVGLAGLWEEIKMDWCGYAHEIPHIGEVIQIFERMPGGVEEIGPLWLFGQDMIAKRDQVVQIVESFDKILIPGSDAGLHLSLVQFICRDMGAEGQSWHTSSQIPEDLRQRLSGIRDPCLTLIAVYACGFLRSVEVEFSESYLSRHLKSVDAFITLVYQRMSPNDSPENWQLCDSLGPIIARSVRNICPKALVDPGQLVR
jgi:hypothetical protein